MYKLYHCSMTFLAWKKSHMKRVLHPVMFIDIWSSYSPTTCNHYCSWDQFSVHSLLHRNTTPTQLFSRLLCTALTWQLTDYSLTHSLTNCLANWLTHCLTTHSSAMQCTEMNWTQHYKSLTANFIGMSHTGKWVACLHTQYNRYRAHITWDEGSTQSQATRCLVHL
jgi:hypothetical protein